MRKNEINSAKNPWIIGDDFIVSIIHGMNATNEHPICMASVKDSEDFMLFGSGKTLGVALAQLAIRVIEKEGEEND